MTCNSPKGITYAAKNTLVPPTEQDDSKIVTFEHVKGLLDGSILGNPLPYLFLPLAESFIGALVTTYETPIQFRNAMYHGNVNYNVVAMYHATALDIWGKDEKRICISDFSSDEEKRIHEEVAIAYTFAYSAISAAPSSKTTITHIMDNVLKLPMSNVLSEMEPDLGTPWGLAKVRVEEMYKFAESDGWNADGSLTHKRKWHKSLFCIINHHKLQKDILIIYFTISKINRQQDAFLRLSVWELFWV